jgi:hypothetical protein
VETATTSRLLTTATFDVDGGGLGEAATDELEGYVDGGGLGEAPTAD